MTKEEVGEFSIPINDLKDSFTFTIIVDGKPIKNFFYIEDGILKTYKGLYNRGLVKE